MKNIIGIDISKEYFDAFMNNNVIRFKNDLNGFTKFIKSIPLESHCIMESTSTYCYKLAYFILNSGSIVYIINPLRIKHFTRMNLSKCKTDKQDAINITKYAEKMFDELTPFIPASKNLEECKQIYNSIDQFDKHRIALINQLESIENHNFQNKILVKTLKNSIKNLEKEIEKLEKLAEDLIKVEHSKMLEDISSIKGIGTKTAALIIAKTNGFSNFEDSKKVSSFFGCCPRVHESGSSVKSKGMISKIGHSDIRTRLYMCSLSAIKHNKRCKDLYIRLISKGKAKKVAMLAVANKLISQIFAIAKSGEKYIDCYEKTLAY
ncbi:MAG: IS110 family transposase [Candidatus Kapabacteria bacterium]|nr:IS110 family transposase [Candidatus Kapabacteria bacterium]